MPSLSQHVRYDFLTGMQDRVRTQLREVGSSINCYVVAWSVHAMPASGYPYDVLASPNCKVEAAKEEKRLQKRRRKEPPAASEKPVPNVDSLEPDEPQVCKKPSMAKRAPRAAKLLKADPAGPKASSASASKLLRGASNASVAEEPSKPKTVAEKGKQIKAKQALKDLHEAGLPELELPSIEGFGRMCLGSV